MPIRESICTDSMCIMAGEKVEHYYPRQESAPSPCPSCGSPTRFVPSTFAIVFTGVISARYNYSDAENPHQEGHVMWGKDPVTGKPVSRRIETFDEQRRACKEFGYANPSEMPRNYQIKDGGKGEANTVGLPGCEV